MSAQQASTESAALTTTAQPIYLPTIRHTIDEDGDLILELIAEIEEEGTPKEMEVDGAPLTPQNSPTEQQGEAPPKQEVLRKTELVVSSRVIRFASPVFRAMLQPDRFLEGITFGANSKGGLITRLSLPDDDPQAMAELCSLMHHKIPPQLYSPSFDQLSELAVIVDKYELTELVWFQSQAWMAELAPHAADKGREPTLLMSYLFGNQIGFEAVTKTLLYEFCGDFREIFDGFKIPVPESVFVALEKKKKQIGSFFFQELRDATELRHSFLWGTRWACKQKFKEIVEKLIRKQGIYFQDHQFRSIESLLGMLRPHYRELQGFDEGQKECKICGCERCGNALSMESLSCVFTVIRSHVQSMMDANSGICLGCCLGDGGEGRPGNFGHSAHIEGHGAWVNPFSMTDNPGKLRYIEGRWSRR